MITRTVRQLAALSLVFACLFTLTGFLGQSSWLLDLTSHFRLAYAPFLLTGALMLAWRKCPKTALIVLGFALLNLWTILPYYPAHNDVETAPNLPRFRLVQFNAWIGSMQREKSVDWLKTTQADAVVLEECSETCVNAIQQGLAERGYEHVVAHPERNLAIVSKHPMERLVDAVPAGAPILAVRMDRAGQRVHLLAAHLSRPNDTHLAYGNEISNLTFAVQNARFLGDPVILAGDFNTTPFSFYFRLLIEDTGLVNTQDRFGLSPTYPAHVPKTHIPWPIPILPIDHVLVTPDIGVLNRRNGPHAGSDHLPVVVDLALPRS